MVMRGTPSQSASKDHDRVSLMSVSPISKKTARMLMDIARILFQARHLRGEHQRHAAAAGIAVEDGRAVEIIVESVLLVGGLADIEENPVRAYACEYRAPGFVDPRLVSTRIDPAIANTAQHRCGNHCG